MRGISLLPGLFANRLAGGDGAARAGRGRGAPQAASRSQTDAVGFAQFAMSMALGRRARPEGRSLVIPLRDDSEEDQLRRTFRGKGSFLARQEEWDVLGRMIRETDRNRDMLPDGTGMADLLAEGARADAVQAARDALDRGQKPPRSIMASLEEALHENPACWGVALVVARAHMDVGLAWLGDRPLTTRPSCDKPQFLQHFRRAADILDPWVAVEQNSAALAVARCVSLMGEPDAPARAADDFEDLIDLDPVNPRHMRKMGLALMPRWYGSYEKLDDIAHETAERTEDIWGDGAYAWVWMDVLRAVPESAARLDVDRYVAGMRDILEMRGNQTNANVLAAHCGVAMSPEATAPDLSHQAMRARAQIEDCFPWIINEHLRELSPRVWAEMRFSPFHALPAADELTEGGIAMAHALISARFEQELAEGHTIAFTPEGIELRARRTGHR